MKKVLYTLAVLAMGLTTSCTTFDDETVMDYGKGPAVNLSLVSRSDSTFAFSLAPDEGTAYYAFVIDQSSEVDSTLSASDLIAGNYGGLTLNAKEKASYTTGYRVYPNSSFVIYAVANNDKGVLGEIEILKVVTTDGVAPFVYEFDNDNNQIAVYFDNEISLSSADFSAFYLKEWDIENPVAIPTEDIDYLVRQNFAQFTFSNIPAGAYVFLNWEKGAFVDAVGNEIAAQKSYLDLDTEDFVGLWYRQANETWAIAVSDFTPATGMLITDAATFVGTVDFGRDIYVIEDELTDDDIKVTYSSDTRTVTYNLPVENWSVADSSLSFTLPYAGEPGDEVTVSIAEGTVYDVYGNGNAAFADSKLSWTVFAPTKDMVLGDFNFLYMSAYDDTPQVYDGGKVTIVETEKEDSVVIKDLYLEGSVFAGRLDLAAGKLYIEPYELIGMYTNSQGTTYGLVLYSLTYADEIACDINGDGSITTTDMGVVAYNADLSSALGWWDKFSIAAFYPVEENAAAAKGAKAPKAAKSVKSARIPNLIVR